MKRLEGGPPISLVRQLDTHRLIPSRHLPRGDSVLVAIADDDEHLQAIFELDAATNERVLAAQQLLPGIGVEELVFAVPYASVINASFCHAHPLGSRFNGPDRGAWYAGFELETSQAEVAFHKTVQLAEINRFEDSVTYDDYLADVSASFHDLRPSTTAQRAPNKVAGRNVRAFRDCLDPGSYVASQTVAERLLAAGSLGMVYPSVRRTGGTCVGCFRPALVNNVRPDKTYRFTWNGSEKPVITIGR
ncbi:MAG TPA: RES family NAD+ phosphorylase [Vicinamibacterales bacterium]|nr:RES family NAD+ phosphorylase [Vicinamibacterales bacterium]